MADKLSDNDKLSERAITQKKRLLSAGQYATTPHFIYRELLPELTSKYGGKTARDCVLLYGYLQAHVNGESDKETYMWAFPSVKQINDDTGIHGDRIRPLVDILVSEGVMITRKIPWYGHTKKMYMPLFDRG